MELGLEGYTIGYKKVGEEEKHSFQLVHALYVLKTQIGD